MKLDVLDAGAPLPAAMIDLATVNDSATGYEGMNVCIGPSTVVDTNPEPGPGDADPGMTYEFVVADDSGNHTLLINDLFFRPVPFVEVGQSLKQACGILRFAKPKLRKLEPRNADELVLGSPFVRAFSATEGFVRVGPQGPVKDLTGNPITIQLSGAANEDGQSVQLTSSMPQSLQVPQTVIVPPNTEAAPLKLRASCQTKASPSPPGWRNKPWPSRSISKSLHRMRRPV